MGDLVAAADLLCPAIAARADEIEANRRMPTELVDDLAGAGLFHALVPASLGGLDRAPRELAVAVEHLAAADGSVAWCVMIGATTALAAGRMDQALAKEVWGGRRGVAAGTLNPAGRGTWLHDGSARVSGRWSWLSGSWHADAFLLGCIVGEGDVRHCMVAAGDATIHDVWEVVGLCGTASNDASLDGHLLSPDRVVDLTAPPVIDHPLAAAPFITLMAPVLASVATGIARGALDDLVALADAKVPYQSRVVLADRPQLQAGLAKAEAGLRSARLLLFDALDSLWDDVVAGRPPTLAARGLVRLASTHAVEASVAAVDAAWTLAGGSALSRAGTLQRRFRDVHCITQHILVGPSTWELAGRTLVGRAHDGPFTL